jgi:septal ring factor EnvC (AmiA/AmiB activator)
MNKMDTKQSTQERNRAFKNSRQLLEAAEFALEKRARGENLTADEEAVFSALNWSEDTVKKEARRISQALENADRAGTQEEYDATVKRRDQAQEKASEVRKRRDELQKQLEQVQSELDQHEGEVQYCEQCISEMDQRLRSLRNFVPDHVQRMYSAEVARVRSEWSPKIGPLQDRYDELHKVVHADPHPSNSNHVTHAQRIREYADKHGIEGVYELDQNSVGTYTKITHIWHKDILPQLREELRQVEAELNDLLRQRDESEAALLPMLDVYKPRKDPAEA